MTHSGSRQQGDDLGADAAGAVDPYARSSATFEVGDHPVGRGGGEVEGVEVWFEAVSLGQWEVAQRAGAGGGVVEDALGGELVEQGPGACLVDPGAGRVAEDGVEAAGAVEALDPLPDGSGQAAQHDCPQRVDPILKGLLVAEDAPEDGLHTWPHGGKVSMPEQDPELVRRRLWITT
ncbi:hypothetical protein [Nonomuraea fuscirosea]|uniref:hypothetical protein n=1 Tax=Nonomuraea fuscirosea TaxID=1291556 RepID=UPI00341DB69E